MLMPKIKPGQTFEDVESAEGITKEVNDIRPRNLGCHPSQSFYREWGLNLSTKKLVKSRQQFDRVAMRYC